LLAKKWRLDNALIDSVESHHLSAGNNKNLITNVVTVINNLCKHFHFGESGDPLEEEIAGDLIKKLNISSNTLKKISDQLPSEINKAAEFLNIIQEHKI
jgi:HD-like signal output (HDOD) protein